MHFSFRLSLFLLLIGGLFPLQAQDTLEVTTFDFTDPSPIGFSAPYRGTFQFPDTSEKYAKVLMYYTLKCDPATNQDGFDCGEWDYLTYTYVFDSTGWYDSTYRTHPNFQLGGSTPDSLALTYAPQYRYTQDKQYTVQVTDTNQLALRTIGSGQSQTSQPMAGQQPRSRVQYLWRATELTSGGLSAGAINGLQLDLSTLPSELKYFQIRLKQSALDSLTTAQTESGGFQTVYRRHTDFTLGTAGWQPFLFTQPFVWDGSSNLVVEFSYDNGLAGSNGTVKADSVGFSAGVYTNGDEHFLSFQGPDIVRVDPSVLTNRLHDQVTLSFWQYGDPSIQPQSDYAIEARDTSNRRVFNVHLPWGNGQVYWDAGNSGTASYDRINQPANFADFAGQWNHWTFTKDAISGEMEMYLNGQLWLSGTGKNRTMGGIASFVIGASTNGNGSYDGWLDEVQVWDTVLDQSTIQTWMNRSLTPAHPQYNHLLAYFPFNEGSGTSITDQSPNAIAAELQGFPDWQAPRPQDLFRDWTATRVRPQVRFDQSNYVTNLDSVSVRDSVALFPSEVILFGNDPQGRMVREGAPNHPTTPTDTLSAWLGNQYAYVYDWGSGAVVDSIWQGFDTLLQRQDIEYYSNVVRYELGRYITPYGINLDLGPSGKTWVFDITDYAPLLHDAVRLQAGNNQELLDLRFVMIKGTPPRSVKGIENLWNGSFSYASLVSDQNGSAIQKVLNPAAQMFSVKTRTTGHGFNNSTNCSEFCPRFHHLLLDQQQAFSWYLWNECSNNFVYPQGGTWIYDRAGWCPGAKVQTYVHELTPLVQAGDTVTLDYDVQDSGNEPNHGNYVLEAQLFSYSSPNFQKDVELSEIVRPSNKDEFSRMNPICDRPVIEIRNLGSDTIHSVKVKYGTEDGVFPCYYYWEGSLAMFEKQEITLPRFNWTGTNQTTPRFYAEILEVNGEAGDEQSWNNRLETPFSLVTNYDPGLVLQIRSNNAGPEHSYRIYDKDGNVVKFRFGLASNTTYRDTLDLGLGCYRFHFMDTGQDGIAWWANNDGTGHVLLFDLAGNLVHSFESDYGMDIDYQFTVGYSQGTEAPDVTCSETVSVEAVSEPAHFSVYPNPSEGNFQVALALQERQNVRLRVLDPMGKVVYQEAQQGFLSGELSLDLALSAGVYFVEVQADRYRAVRSLVVQ